MNPAMHYSGGVEYVDGRGHLVVCGPGYPACCSGDRARGIRARGHQTEDRKAVRCKGCLKRLALQDARLAPKGSAPAEVELSEVRPALQSLQHRGVTEAEVQAVLATFPDEEREAIEAQRADLAAAGVTRLDLQLEMACRFADLLLSLRRARLVGPPPPPQDPA